MKTTEIVNELQDLKEAVVILNKMANNMNERITELESTVNKPSLFARIKAKLPSLPRIPRVQVIRI